MTDAVHDEVIQRSAPLHQSTEHVSMFVTMLWVACSPTLFVFGNRALAGVPILNCDRVAYLVVTLLFVYRVLSRPLSLQTLGNVEKAMALFLTVVLLSWMTTLVRKDANELKQDADFLLSSFVMPFTAFVVARNAAWTRRRIIGCLWVLVGGVGVYLVVVGIVQAKFDSDFLVIEAAKRIHRDRAKASFDNSLPYALVVSILLTLALFLSLHMRNRLGRLATWVVAGGLVEAIVLSKGRALWLGVPITMLFASLRCPRIRPLAASVTIGLVSQVLLWPLSGDDLSPHNAGLHERLTEVDSLYDRVAVYATDLNMIVHRPVFGFGFGLQTFQRHKVDYYTSCCNISPKWAADCFGPHNEIFNVLILAGVVGLLAFLALVWAIWQLLSVRVRSPDSFDSELALFVQAAFVLVAITAQFHDVTSMAYVQLLFFFLLGVVAHAPCAAEKSSAARTGVP